MNLRHRALLLTLIAVLPLLAFADTSMLRPPLGSNVALIVFEDMECPVCAQAAPLIAEAVRTYNIPLVVHDFPLQQHPWSFDAAVLAVFFDSKSKKIGEDFRTYIFKNQPQITKANLRSYADKFAAEQKVDLPFAFDPRGEFAAKVKSDRDLGNRIPIVETPTIYVVGNRTQGPPFIEVKDRTQLYLVIDQMKKDATPVPAAKTPAKTPAKKTSVSKTAKQ